MGAQLRLIADIAAELVTTAEIDDREISIRCRPPEFACQTRVEMWGRQLREARFPSAAMHLVQAVPLPAVYRVPLVR
jgi:hypothetical protein